MRKDAEVTSDALRIATLALCVLLIAAGVIAVVTSG